MTVHRVVPMARPAGTGQDVAVHLDLGRSTTNASVPVAVAALLGLVLLVAGCSSSTTATIGSATLPTGTLAGSVPPATATPGGTVAPGSVPASNDLTRTSWTLTYLVDASGDRTPAVAGSTATLSFDGGGRLSGSTGCNSFNGTWTTSGTSITLTLGPMTQKACDPILIVQEKSLTMLLPKITTYSVAGDALTLRSNEGPGFVYVPAQTGITGTDWNVTGVNNGKGGVESTPLTGALNAGFGADGSFTGFGGCNQFTGTYKTSGSDGLTLGPLATTMRACADQSRNELEANYGAALAKVATYEIRGDTLTMRDSSGATQVTATRRPSTPPATG
jgi:heat shock protein HslJ